MLYLNWSISDFQSNSPQILWQSLPQAFPWVSINPRVLWGPFLESPGNLEKHPTSLRGLELSRPLKVTTKFEKRAPGNSFRNPGGLMTGDDDTHFLATVLLWIKKCKANSKLTKKRSRKMRSKSFRTLYLKNAFSNLAKLMLDIFVSLSGFFVHAIQSKLWSVKSEGVRLWKMGASVLERSKYLASPMKHSIRSKSPDPIKASLHLPGDASI